MSQYTSFPSHCCWLSEYLLLLVQKSTSYPEDMAENKQTKNKQDQTELMWQILIPVNMSETELAQG